MSPAFHQVLHCLLRQNRLSEKKILYFLDVITCDTSVYTMDHPDLTVSNFMEKSIGLHRGSYTSAHVLLNLLDELGKR